MSQRVEPLPVLALLQSFLLADRIDYVGVLARAAPQKALKQMQEELSP
jgi:hypothetical protein